MARLVAKLEPRKLLSRSLELPWTHGNARGRTGPGFGCGWWRSGGHLRLGLRFGGVLLRGGIEHSELVERVLEIEAALTVAIERVLQRLKLQARALQHLEIRRHLGRQLSGVPLAVIPRARLELLQALAGFFHLLLEELIGSHGQPLSILQVLFDEERGKALGDLHDLVRRITLVRHAEQIALDDVDGDVVPHVRDHSFARRCFPLLRIEIELADDALEPRLAQNLRADRQQPLLDRLRNGGTHVVLRHALRHDENQRRRAIAIRQRQRHPDGGHREEERRPDDEPLPLPQNPHHARRRIAPSWQHYGVLRPITGHEYARPACSP